MHASDLLQRLTELPQATRLRVLARVGNEHLTAWSTGPSEAPPPIPEASRSETLDWFATGGGAPADDLVQHLAAAMALEEGEEECLIGQSIGRVRIDELIGRGGMGSVYRGWDQTLERAVAVKVLRTDLGGSEAWRERFRHEARLLGSVEHPSICRIYDLIEAEACDYLILELVEGQSFSHWLAANPNRESRLRFLRQVAEALAFAHDRGIVHRDLKPDNVLVEHGTGAKVLDFGIALSVPGQEDSHHPPAGAIAQSPAGTLLYMSPEQARGEAVDSSSDLFSLGLLLQETFTSVPAYPTHLTSAELLSRVQRGETAQTDALEPAINDLLLRLLSPFPARRPKATEAVEALMELELAPQRRLRRRQLWLLAAAVLVVVGLSFSAVLRERIETARQATLIQELARQTEEIAWTMRVARLGPTRDLSQDRDRLLAAMADLELRLPELGMRSRGPASSALGRAYLELLDWHRSRHFLDAAWEAGARDTATAWARSQVYGRLWAEASSQREKTRGEASPASEEENSYRAEALAMLETSGSAAPQAHLKILIAQYEGRIQDGLDLARATADAAPSDWKVRLLEARLLRRRGNRQQWRGDRNQEALANYRLARERSLEAARIARSASEVWLEACTNATVEAQLLVVGMRRTYPEELRREADRICGTAELVGPWVRDQISWSRNALDALLVMTVTNDGEAEEVARKMLRRLDAAIASQPEFLLHRQSRASTREILAVRRGRRGGQQIELLDLAALDRRHVAQAEPEDLAATTSYIDVLGNAAIEAVEAGRDDAETRLGTYAKAIDEGRSRFPEAASLRNADQLASVMIGRILYDRAEDCAPQFEQALRLGESLAAENNDVVVRANGSYAGALLVECRLRTGNSPGDAAQRSLKLAESALELAPRLAPLWSYLAGARIASGQVQRHLGVLSDRTFGEAVAAADRASELDPQDLSAHHTRANAFIQWAAARADQQRPAKDLLTQGQRSLDRAASVRPDAPEALVLQALHAAVASRLTSTRGEAAVRDARELTRRATDLGAAAGALWQVEYELRHP